MLRKMTVDLPNGGTPLAGDGGLVFQPHDEF